MSHNPYTNSLYQILTITGQVRENELVALRHVSHIPANHPSFRTYHLPRWHSQLVWDESRDFGYEYRQQMHDLVKSHRGHTSVMIWSYGNEYELQQVAQNMTNLAYRDLTMAADPTRPTSENDMTVKVV